MTLTTTEVLQKASNEDLDPLVEYILKATVSEHLSVSDVYKSYAPDHCRYHSEILSEIRSFGGNTFANLGRGGEGPDYFEVVCDVAKKFKINKPDGYSLVALEEAIIFKILQDACDKAESLERADMEAALKEAGLNQKDLSALLSGSSLATILGARMAGVVTYQVSTIVANAVARQMLGYGLSMGARVGISRGLAVFTGPIGWIITGLWTAIDIAGPAYRVTVPCVIHIAMLRQRFISQAKSSGGNPFDVE